MTTDATSVLARADVGWATVGNEVVVWVPATGATHALDPAAAVLWQCLDGVSRLDAVFADLADAFGVDATVVAADCLPVLRSWLDAGVAVDVRAQQVPAAPPMLRSWRRLVDPPNS